MLKLVLFTMGDHQLILEGASVTTRALSVPPANPLASAAVQHLQRGQEHYAAGRIYEAIAALQAGLDAAGKDSADCPAETIAGLHATLGDSYLQRGHHTLASENYKAALRLAPHLEACWCNFGDVHLRTGRAHDAIPLFRLALKLNPAHWASRSKLAEALMATRQYLAARALLQQLLEERPQASQTRYQLGKVCFELNETEAAIRHFEQAVALDPNDADSRYWIGSIKRKLGDIDAARAAYTAAAQIRPLVRRRAAKSPPVAIHRSNISSRIRPTTSMRWRSSMPASPISPRSETSISSSI